MKNTKKMIMLAVALMMICGSALAQKVEFCADIDEMIPMEYQPQMGLTGFSMEMKNDSVTVHLPYMGNVYNPTYNNDGLNFTETCKDLVVKDTKKKDGRIVTFTINHDIVHYKFTVTLWNNKNVEIFMLPSNAQSCDYRGRY